MAIKKVKYYMGHILLDSTALGDRSQFGIGGHGACWVNRFLPLPFSPSPHFLGDLSSLRAPMALRSECLMQIFKHTVLYFGLSFYAAFPPLTPGTMSDDCASPGVGSGISFLKYLRKV